MKNSKSISRFLFLTVLLYAGALVFVNRLALFSRVDMQKIQADYEGSNYVLGDRGHKMSDDDVYAYAGYVYASGASPASVNFEHPPFVKYLYGFAYALFGNPRWVVSAFIVIQALCLVAIARKLYADKRLVVVSTLLFLANSLVYGYFSKTLLDIPLAGMMLLSIVCYLGYLSKPTWKRAALFGAVSGLYLSSKYPIPLSVGLYGLLVAAAWWKKRNLGDVAVMGVSTAALYLLTYAAFFLQGHSFIEFLQFENWRLHWFLGKTDAPKGLILQTVLFGRHAAWWAGDGSVTAYPNYTILWPATFLLFMLSFFRKVKHGTHLFVFKLWTVLSFLLLMLGASNDFYLVPLLPGFVLFGVQMFDKERKSG